MLAVMSLSACLIPSRSRAPEKLAHQDDVVTLAFSPDGAYLASGGEDKTLVVWHLQSRGRHMEAQLDAPLVTVAYSPSGQHLAAGDAGSTVAVFDVATKEEIDSTQVEGGILALALGSRPRGLLAVGTKAKNVVLLSLLPGLDVLAVLQHGGDVQSLDFSPMANFLVGGGGTDDKFGLMTHKTEGCGAKAVLWQLADDALESSAPAASVDFADIVRAVRFSICGRLLAVGGEDRQISILLPQQGLSKVLALRCLAGVRCLAWSPNAHFLASGGEDNQVCVWDVIAGSIAFTLPKAADWICAVALSSDGQWLASCGFGRNEVQLDPLDDCHNAGIAAADVGTRPALFRTASLGTKSGGGYPSAGGEDNIKAADLAARAAAASCIAQNTTLLSAILGMDLSPATIQVSETRASVQLEHGDEVMDLAFSPDGRGLLAGGEDAQLVLWDVASGARRLDARLDASVAAVAYSPSGRFMAAGTVESSLTVWDTGSCAEAETSELEEGGVLSLAMTSSPRELLAVGLRTKKVLLMSVPGLETLVLLQHCGDVRSVCFSPNGAFLAGCGGSDDMHGLMTVKSNTASRGMTAIAWQVPHKGAECPEVASIDFSDLLHTSAFSPSGKVFAVGGESGKVSILLVERHFEVVSELSCAAGVRCLVWSSDSRFLASGGEDLHVSIWDVKSEHMVLKLPKEKDWVVSIAFSPDSLWLASCGFGCPLVRLHAIEVLHGSAAQGVLAEAGGRTWDVSSGAAEGTVSVSIGVPDLAAALPVASAAAVFSVTPPAAKDASVAGGAVSLSLSFGYLRGDL